jgi:hypothetical protein
MEKMASDSWFARRMMKMTRFEKWLVNSPQRARQAEQAALALFGDRLRAGGGDALAD